MNSDPISLLQSGGIGVIPTDTLYGLVGLAFSQVAVERIYELKGRDTNKPLIVLISSIDDLQQFGAEPDESMRTFMEQHWPGKISIILQIHNPDLSYLSRSGNTVAFRVPDKPELIEFLKKTGPLVAPSANPQGEAPAETIEQAEKYFGEQVDFYSDGGELISEPSTLVQFKDGKIEVLRQGAVRVL